MFVNPTQAESKPAPAALRRIDCCAWYLFGLPGTKRGLLDAPKRPDARRGGARAIGVPEDRAPTRKETELMRSLFDGGGPRATTSSRCIRAAGRPRRAAPAGTSKAESATRSTGSLAVLATLVALAILRLEDGSDDAVRGSVALTESFIADMDAQMREEGFGDPSVGKQVRSMVGALASRGRPLAPCPRRRNPVGRSRCASASIATNRRQTAPRPSRRGAAAIRSTPRRAADDAVLKGDFMSDFAHRPTLDRIRDGDRLDLVADSDSAPRSPRGSASPRSNGSMPMRCCAARAP